MATYTVIIGDCAGERTQRDFRTFTDAKRYAEVVRRSFPKLAAFVVNTNRMDVGSDGLTQDEREEL